MATPCCCHASCSDLQHSSGPCSLAPPHHRELARAEVLRPLDVSVVDRRCRRRQASGWRPALRTDFVRCFGQSWGPPPCLQLARRQPSDPAGGTLAAMSRNPARLQPQLGCCVQAFIKVPRPAGLAWPIPASTGGGGVSPPMSFALRQTTALPLGMNARALGGSSRQSRG